MAKDVMQATLADVLVGLGQGRFHDEATERLADLVKEMNRVAEVSGGKPKGKLVITFDLMLDRGIFELNPSMKVTTPSLVRARTIMYSTPDGQLSKNDTRQGVLGLTPEGRTDVVRLARYVGELANGVGMNVAAAKNEVHDPDISTVVVTVEGEGEDRAMVVRVDGNVVDRLPLTPGQDADEAVSDAERAMAAHREHYRDGGG